MGRYDKEYDAFQIFEQIQEQTIEEESSGKSSQPVLEDSPQRRQVPDSPQRGQLPEASQRGQVPEASQPKRYPTFQDEAPYYEIEYDSCPLPGVGRFVLKSDKIQTPPAEEDPVRVKFYRMRDIARENRTPTFSNSKFYDTRIQQENARLFYMQGMFMKDFEDSYDLILPYSAYYPNYQMLGYKQLRTYFSWRTQVRQGDIYQTSLSYAFLYLYELLNNIGVEDPEEGLEKLLLFWDAYRIYDRSIDKYVLKWLKDYHIYYELPWSFREFVQQNKLEAYYPELSAPENAFDLYCTISKYDIRKSKFYSEERVPLIKGCFQLVLDRLRDAFDQSHINLEEYIFQPTRNMTAWTPFQGALFYPALRQADRQVMFSKKEIYQCRDNRWTFSKAIITESGKQLIGFCMKQMESVLRRLTNYKHKLTASTESFSPVMAEELHRNGIAPEAIVTGAVEDFYREATKTVVKVDNAVLEKIRREALVTQERLIVPEEAALSLPGVALYEHTGQPGAEKGKMSSFAVKAEEERDVSLQVANAREKGRMSPFAVYPEKPKERSFMGDNPEKTADNAMKTAEIKSFGEMAAPQTGPSPQEPQNEWADLRDVLTEIERKALQLAVSGSTGGIRKFADANGIMLEVLMDGINEKSMDCVGDSILDDDFEVYDDYTDQVKGMVESL